MTLSDFRRETEHMPGATQLLSLAPWGELGPARIITIDDLPADDDLKNHLPHNAIAITNAAD